MLLSGTPVLLWAQGQPSGTPTRPPPTAPSISRQDCKLSGRVLYASEFKGAERIHVRIVRYGATVEQLFTDSLGRFESRELPPTAYEIEIVVDGYKPVRERVDASMNCRSELPPIMLEREVEFRVQAEGAMVSAAELLIPEKARKAFEKGMRELHEKNRPERSLPHFREAIALYPDYDLAYMQLGLAHVQQNQLSEAQEQLEKSTEINNKNSRAFVLLGLVHGLQGQVTDSLRVLREAVRIDNGDWLGHFELGRTLLQVGLLEEAHRHALRAHQLKPDTPNVHLLLHEVCVRRGDYQTALAEVQEFLERFPKDPQAPRMKQQEKALLQSGLQPK